MTKKILVLAMLFVAASILKAGIVGAAALTDSIWSQHLAAQDSQAGKAALKAKQTAEKAPPYYENVEDVKDIPKTLSPGAFDDPTTKQAYQVAQDNPKLLLQLPCYCPCDRADIGHKSLLDCFVDTHAAGCGICKSEAIRAARLQKEGVSIQDIRLKLAADYSKGH